MRLTSLSWAGVLGACTLLALESQGAESMKAASSLYPPAIVAQLRENAAEGGWAADVLHAAVANAAPWRAMSDDALWDLMFGATITRSWMVWSNGHCPACKEPVPMYEWKMDPHNHAWKVQCPHCKERFPKNDFHAFYRSGLDEHGVFDPARGDRTLLFNAEHPGTEDPLRNFGVDDGEGYVDGDKRWRFIGAYLIYGQWKGLILDGIRTLSRPTYSRANRSTRTRRRSCWTGWPICIPPSISRSRGWPMRKVTVRGMCRRGTTPAPRPR